MGIAQESNQYELTVNDSKYVISGSWLGESLLYVLRERLGLYGSKMLASKVNVVRAL